MKEIVLATRNDNKIREIKNLLKDINIKFLSLRDFPSFPPVPETATSYTENAQLKASAVSKFTGKLALADDSGLEVDFLQGRPGVLSARYAGEGASDEENNRKLLGELREVPMALRGAAFRCVLALVAPSNKKETVEGECRGVIALEPRGEGGFGYDPLFYLPKFNKTFAELSPEEKNQVSHRAQAAAKLRKIITEYL
ncbi:MAG: XTP/dITP diphosphatase [Deltaproteobacteria bacterium]|nr:MAG: XTP/dITP diphosphatase [Deltaproteobacteria bacterium]